MGWIRTAAVCAALTLLASCGGHYGDAAGGQPAPAGRPQAATGQMCGGFAGIACASPGEYCASEPGACHHVADYAGNCQARPEVCPMLYKPVCGCDGRTYPNDCDAATHSVSVAYQGECTEGQ